MRYRALDGWRGLAAITIAIFHSPFTGSLGGESFFTHAFLFVDLFFVLSGFVLTYAHIDKGERFLVFSLKRLGRLWPLHMAILGGFFMFELFKWGLALYGHVHANIAPFTYNRTVYSLLTNIFLVQAMGFNSVLSWNGPSWSISTEFWVSLLFCALLINFKRRLVFWALGLSMASAGLLAVVSWRPMEEITHWAFYRCVYGFFAGVALRFLMPAPSGKMTALLEWPIVGIVVYFVCRYQPGWYGLMAVPIFSILVYLFAAEAGWISTFLKSPLMQILGELSYSIYMTHLLVITLAISVLKKYGEHRGILFRVTEEDGLQIDFGAWWQNDVVFLISSGQIPRRLRRAVS